MLIQQKLKQLKFYIFHWAQQADPREVCMKAQGGSFVRTLPLLRRLSSCSLTFSESSVEASRLYKAVLQLLERFQRCTFAGNWKFKSKNIWGKKKFTVEVSIILVCAWWCVDLQHVTWWSLWCLLKNAHFAIMKSFYYTFCIVCTWYRQNTAERCFSFPVKIKISMRRINMQHITKQWFSEMIFFSS